MKFLFLVLFALALGPFAYASQLKAGLYAFKTEVKTSTSAPVSLTAQVVVFPQYSEKGDLYSITLQDIVANSQPELAISASLPFQFIRLESGLIESVNADPSETLELKNLKKSIAEALQVSLKTQAHVALEQGAAGVRNVHYTAATKINSFLRYESTFALSDFTSFAESSGLEAGHVMLSGKKIVLVDPKDQGVLESEAFLEAVKGDEINVVSKSNLRFISNQVAMINMIQEGPFVTESLVHGLNPLSRLAQLKARLPSLTTLFSLVTSSSSKDAIKARAQLALLMNSDEAALEQGLAFLAAELKKDAPMGTLAVLYSTVARVNAMEAQSFLAQEILNAASAERQVLVLKSLSALASPAAPSVLVQALTKVEASGEIQALVELTLAHVAKFLNEREAFEVLAPFAKRLHASTSAVEKAHLLYVLGNAEKYAPAELIAKYLFDESPQVRSAAVTSLRNQMHTTEVQEAVSTFISQAENRMNKGVMGSFVGAMRENMKKHNLFRSKIHETLAPLATSFEEVRELLVQLGPLPTTPEIQGKSTTTIWNNTSDPLFNLIASTSQRQQDVDRYPYYNGYLMGAQYGPRPANLKVATGVFSGSGDDGCLAGNFKIFDKLYTETQLLGDVLVLADLYLYVLNFNNEFDSRIYGLINGNVILDIHISNNCSSEEFAIFHGEIDIIFWETELPLDIGNVYIYLDASAYLGFDAGYKICLLTGSPYVELFVTGEVSLTADAEATVTILGVIRAGLEFHVYLNYLVGPDTQLGSRNNTAGELVCEACIGVYYGYDDQSAYTGLFIQSREGLGWGEKEQIPLAEWVEPAVPFPTPLIETCSQSKVAQDQIHSEI